MNEILRQDDASPPLRRAKRGAGIENVPLLLARLHTDQQHAGVLYEEIRYRLILFFRLNRPQEAEELADEVLDRVARRLSEGTIIDRIDFYTVGVARFVLRERQAATQREQQAQRQIAYLQQSQSTEEPSSPERSSEALTKCLERLPHQDHAMILKYYGADGSLRIRVRQALAEQLGISLNALHNRALRLRKQLEHCVEAGLKKMRGQR